MTSTKKYKLNTIISECTGTRSIITIPNIEHASNADVLKRLCKDKCVSMAKTPPAADKRTLNPHLFMFYVNQSNYIDPIRRKSLF